MLTHTSILFASDEIVVRTNYTPPVNVDDALLSTMSSCLSDQPWLKSAKLISIHVTDDWSYHRNEFTGLTDSRTIIAEAVVDTGRPGCYEVIPCLFRQSLSFFGLKKGPVIFQFRLHENTYLVRKPAQP